MALLLACAGESEPRTSPPPVERPVEPPVEPPPADPLLAETDRYLHDPVARRRALEESLVEHGNMYSRIRLEAYGHTTRGWDALPVWNPRSMPVTAALVESLERGEMPALPDAHGPLWDGVPPTTMAEWVALGRRVFHEYPMRAEVFMEWALTEPAFAKSVGIERATDGSIPGLVVFQNVDGETRVGITCAVCHSAVRDGEVVVGAAHRNFDYGKLRATYDRTFGFDDDVAQQRRMAKWGPGRADVTEDDDEDPVAIPDLWGLREATYLTSAGTIRHRSPLALAIRQETQLTDSNHQRVRPPRELAWALAMFVYSLEPPRAPAVAQDDRVARGHALFDQHCRSCHANAAHGGGVIDARAIGTDPALATGRGRGTGKYRVPSLLAIRDGAPYLHHGAVRSLEELLSPARLSAKLRRDRIPGHRAGTELAADDRAALVAFLETL